TVSTPIEQLDLATIVRMSQAISGEIEMGSLVETLIVTALEHAGAGRGLLLLPQGQDWHIEAEAKTAGDRISVHLCCAAIAAPPSRGPACPNRAFVSCCGPGRTSSSRTRSTPIPMRTIPT